MIVVLYKVSGYLNHADRFGLYGPFRAVRLHGSRPRLHRPKGKAVPRHTSFFFQKESWYASQKVKNMRLIIGKEDISNTYQESNKTSSKYNFANEEEQFLDVIEDSISALINLGYTRSEVFSVVMEIKRDFNLKKVDIDFTVNSIIPLALKELSKVVK